MRQGTTLITSPLYKTGDVCIINKDFPLSAPISKGDYVTITSTPVYKKLYGEWLYQVWVCHSFRGDLWYVLESHLYTQNDVRWWLNNGVPP